jgi:hypothetical protein
VFSGDTGKLRAAILGTMQPPCPNASHPFARPPPFARLGGALGLSLFAHAAAVSALAWVMHDSGPVSMGRQKGGMAVTLVTARVKDVEAARAASVDAAKVRPVYPTAPLPAAGHRPYRQTTSPSPSPTPSPIPDALASLTPAPLPANPSADMTEKRAEASTPDIARTEPKSETSAPSDPASPAPLKSPTPEARPGAAFATLFAPIVSRPIGRGRWRPAPTQPIQPTQMSADMQREQALQAMQQSLNARVGSMQRVLPGAPLIGHCEVRVDLERRLAQLSCTKAEDEPRLIAMLSGLATASKVSDGAKLVCLQADVQQIGWQDCTRQSPLMTQQANPNTDTDTEAEPASAPARSSP